MQPLVTEPLTDAPVAAGKRLLSLDVFRGAVMAAMVLVNNSGGVRAWPPFRHAAWSGWTFTDTIFPSFLWIAGVALTLSFARRRAAGANRGSLLLHAARRSAILFAFGLFIYLYPHFDFPHMRILGVLQRIAICYFIAAAVYLYTGVRGQIACVIALLAAYWLAMAFIPVPGFGAGRFDLAGNLAHYVDSRVLGAHNYMGRTWDPEGIVSTLPAIASALLGVLAGGILRRRGELSERACAILAFGVTLLAAGMILNSWLPINKQLWTSTFAVFMAGLSTVGFGVCLWAFDVRGYRPRWADALTMFGRNAIVIYVFSEILDPTLEITGVQPHVMNALVSFLRPENASFIYASMNVLVCFVLAWYLNRRKWMVRF